jgi:hypothetical protein
MLVDAGLRFGLKVAFAEDNLPGKDRIRRGVTEPSQGRDEPAGLPDPRAWTHPAPGVFLPRR